MQAPRHLGWEAGPQDGDRARVWLADDSALEAAHTRGVLSGARAEVETFANGASLLEHLAQPGVVPPDLLLLDWLMPGVSGLDVCRFVRERFSPAQLPILVLTASSCEEDLAEAFGAGANDYVTKPARAVDLLARVRTLLQARRDAEGLREREREHAR
ncbi:MAG TPA: response regulator, partial [Longimicrobium sp.]|nr:response regulator [Longimicrobium sp.]